MSRTKRFLTAGLITFVLLLAAAGGAVYFLLFNPPDPTADEDRIVEIEAGTSTRAIANKLAHDGVIRSPWGFLILRALHPRAKLQAGEYDFSGRPTLFQVFEKIRLGQVYYEEITIPEGSNRFDIAAVLDQSETVTPDDFLAAAKDATGIHDLDPAAPSLEGYLFPSTYRLTAKSTAKDLCRMMTTEFRIPGRERDGRSPGASAGRRRFHEPARSAHAAAVRSNHRLCRIIGQPLPRSHPQVRSCQHQRLQHLCAYRSPAWTYRQSWRLVFEGRFASRDQRFSLLRSER